LGKSILFYECDFFEQRRNIISLLNILSKKVFSLRVSGSVTNDLTSLSCGRAQAAIHFSVKPTDFAAGAIILEEAGGKITDLTGKKLSLNSKNILSTNRKLHNAILKAIR
jgi:myo-inositol-1(or 4)-monophosphatase